jgi:hypothetical protein
LHDLSEGAEKRLVRLGAAKKHPEMVSVQTAVYRRNPDVVAEVLCRANGTCERCNNPAPLIRAKNETPYLEVHHKQQLAYDGEDTIENAIALCPNCYRELHFGGREQLLTNRCTRTHTATLVFVSVAAPHFHTKTLSAVCAGEQSVSQSEIQMLPNFIIIGAMKGGTSSLYRYIASHPDVVPSSTKETDFFKTVDDFNKGLNWYKSLFRKNGKLAFEASPNYTKRHMFPGVPARMYSVLPETKLIYVLRDPIDRVLSHYVHNYAHGRESRPFSEVIRNPDSNYIQTSKYYFQIQAFLEYYSVKQLLLIESERLRRDTVNVVNDVFKFLNLSPKYETGTLEKDFHMSSEKKRRSSLEQVLTSRTNNRYLLSGLRLITAPLRKSIERPKLSSVESAILAEAFAPDVEKLRRFLGLEFSDWSL